MTTTNNKPTDKVEDKADDIEVVINGAPEVEIDVVDDTPPEDKGRKPLAKDALAEDDEAFNLNEKFKRRLGEIRHQAHDERRAKEAALREREEAIAFAKEQMRKARELEQRLSYGEASYAEEMANKAALAKQIAQQKHAKAYEAGDAQAMAEAMSDMAGATQAEENAKRWQVEAKKRIENALQQEKSAVESVPSRNVSPVQEAPKPDARAMKWAEDNDWFGSDPVMTSTVYGVHEKLVKAGVHPVDDADDYYATIDAEMRKRFPEHDWPAEPGKSASAAKKKSPAPVVAPVSRTPAGGKKNTVTLTQTQVKLADKLGLTLEQMAREVLKLGEAS